jgi:hypothetical protein
MALRRAAARASLSTNSADLETAMYLNNNTQTASIDRAVHQKNSVTAASTDETPGLVGNNHTHFHDRVTVPFAGHPDFLAAVFVPQLYRARFAVAPTEMVIR